MDPSDRERNDLGSGSPHDGTDGPTHATGQPEKDDRWLRSVVRNSSEIVTIVDPDGTLRYANPAWQRALGYDPDEATGKMNVLDHVHPEDQRGRVPLPSQGRLVAVDGERGHLPA